MKSSVWGGELPGLVCAFRCNYWISRSITIAFARIAIAAMDIEKIERDAYERGMCDAVELDEWGKSKLFYRNKRVWRRSCLVADRHQHYDRKDA